VQGAILGTAVGAATGAAVDHHKRGRGALIGAAVGGLAGGLVGSYLDRQADEIARIPDVEVERQEDRLRVMFPGDLFFDTGAATLHPGAYGRLDSFASTLRSYPDTDVAVKGHTDSSGSDAFNLHLSEDRADHVRRYLISQRVESYRIAAIGFGESMPVASNYSAEGRARNRRVEIELRPNEALRESHEREARLY
jgi:outer membrane protein OmpA-like peptidoglycan-associated protein